MSYINDYLVLCYMRINPYWQLETYGSAFIIDAKWIKIFLVLICFITIGTNWLIPIILKKVKDIKIRHENKMLRQLNLLFIEKRGLFGKKCFFQQKIL